MRKFGLALATLLCLLAGNASAQFGGMLWEPPVGGCSYPLPVGSASVAAAYSFRKLVSTYAGSAAELSTDASTHQDIGFSGCGFDTASAATFCGAGDCRVTKWYDQSGNGKNATDTYTFAMTYQPNSVNGQPTLHDTALNREQTATLTALTAVSAVGVIQTSTTTATFWVIGTTTNGTSMGYNQGTGNLTCTRLSGGTAKTGTHTLSTATYLRVICNLNANLSQARVSGTAGTDDSSSQSIPSETALAIGGGVGGGGNINGDIAELIFLAPDDATDADTISANQKTWFALAN